MKINPDASPYEGTEDFWYALVDGGYIDPDEMLLEGAEEVNKAILTLLRFRKLLEKNNKLGEY